MARSQEFDLDKRCLSFSATVGSSSTFSTKFNNGTVRLLFPSEFFCTYLDNEGLVVLDLSRTRGLSAWIYAIVTTIVEDF